MRASFGGVARWLAGWVVVAGLSVLTGCGTVGDLVGSHVPDRHPGRAAIVVRVREQRAYLFKGGVQVAAARISTGREGHGTPLGRFRVTRKDAAHRSSLYGSYVDVHGRVVRPNVDRRKDLAPPGTHYVGAPMPWFLEFRPGYGLHEGYLPGYPASHGCVRLPHWRAEQFYDAARVGTPVTVSN